VPTVTSRLVLLAAFLAGGGVARAQDAAPGAIEDPRAARFADVERGLSVGFEVGYLSLLKTRTEDRSRFPYAGSGGGRSQGVDIAVGLGYDLTPRLAVALFAAATSQRADASYGAFDLLAGGLDLRYAFYGLRDRNGWERFFVYLHARGGYLVSHPRGLFGSGGDVLVGGGLGAEYYTQLRHFSVGVQLDGLYVVSAGAPGLALTPTVRYTF
jgi:hypothetical protein